MVICFVCETGWEQLNKIKEEEQMKEKITEFDIMEEQHDLDIRLRKHKQLLASIRKGRRMGEEEE